MKSSNSRVPFKGCPSAEIELDKTQSKFNRRQFLHKEMAKKFKNISKEEEQRVCYMSLGSINMLLASPGNSNYIGKSPSSSVFLGSPSVPHEESFIPNIEADLSDHCRMSDSLLSIYNELDKDGKNKE